MGREHNTRKRRHPGPRNAVAAGQGKWGSYWLVVSLMVLTMLVLTMLVAACGDSTSEPGRAPTTAPTSSVEPSVLRIYGPLGFKAGFSLVRPVLDESGLPYAEYDLFEGPSTTAGVEGLIRGVFDLVTLMRKPLPDEPLAFMELVHTPIGIFVNPEIGITNLTREQAVAIFTGEVTNWSEVGGPDLAITVFVQEPDDTITVTFRDTLLDGAEFTMPSGVLLTEFDVFPVVAGLTGAVSYASYAGLKSLESDLQGTAFDPVMLDGCSPDDPKYWLVSQVGLAWLPERQDYVMPFLAWVADFIDAPIGVNKASTKRKRG